MKFRVVKDIILLEILFSLFGRIDIYKKIKIFQLVLDRITFKVLCAI